MSANIIISVATFFLVTVTALVVLIEDRKSRVNISFTSLCFSIALWIVSNIFADLSENETMALFWSKCAIVWPVIMTNFYFYLVVRLYYSEQYERYKNILRAFFASALFIVLLSPTSFNIRSVNIEEWGTEYVPGGLYYFLSIHLFIGFSWALYLLWRIYRSSDGSAQYFQAKYMFFGTVTTLVLASLANILLPLFGYSITSILGPPSVLFFIGSTAYAITKHHLFNVKVIATELLTFTIWFFLLFQTLLAKDLSKAFISGGLLAFCIIFGVFLIRGVIREIEQREKLEQLNRDLEAANKKLQELDAVKSRFLSFASHQVKTPMTAIKGFACLIYYNADKLSKPKIKQMADKMKLSTDRTISLVNNLLDLRKIEEGRMQYAFEEAKIADVTREVIEELRLIAQEKGLYFVLETPTYEGTVRMDVQKMREVMQNLVENAIKYTDKGWVRVAVTEKEGKVLFSVRDSGRGITENALPLLFKEYERGSAVATAIQGTGLGLFIAKQIVTDHDGRIWAESTGDKKGSSFFVELPLTVPAGEPQAQAVPTMPVVTI